MNTTIRKKSLYYSLKENKIKVKKATKWLILFSLLINLVLLISAITFLNKEYVYVIVFLSGITIYLCYTIFTLWQTHKKIKQKIKTL